jgi:hypothetical protein
VTVAELHAILGELLDRDLCPGALPVFIGEWLPLASARVEISGGERYITLRSKD